MSGSLRTTMRRTVRRGMQIATMNGLGHAPMVLQSLRGMPAFFRDAVAYRQAQQEGPFPLRLGGLLPILGDRYGDAGALGHYFHQDLWAARRIFERRPGRHVDIGSRLDG